MGKGANGNEAPPVPEKNRGRAGKRTCKLAEREQNHVTKEVHAGRGQETKQEIATNP